jgi:hypothetical protein
MNSEERKLAFAHSGRSGRVDLNVKMIWVTSWDSYYCDDCQGDLFDVWVKNDILKVLFDGILKLPYFYNGVWKFKLPTDELRFDAYGVIEFPNAHTSRKVDAGLLTEEEAKSYPEWETTREIYQCVHDVPLEIVHTDLRKRWAAEHSTEDLSSRYQQHCVAKIHNILYNIPSYYYLYDKHAEELEFGGGTEEEAFDYNFFYIEFYARVVLGKRLSIIQREAKRRHKLAVLCEDGLVFGVLTRDILKHVCSFLH